MQSLLVVRIVIFSTNKDTDSVNTQALLNVEVALSILVVRRSVAALISPGKGTIDGCDALDDEDIPFGVVNLVSYHCKLTASGCGNIRLVERSRGYNHYCYNHYARNKDKQPFRHRCSFSNQAKNIRIS